MPNPNPSVKTRFKKGASGNPGGKPVGARNAVTASFLRDLRVVWETHGASCLERLVADDPGTFVRVVASLVPKEIAAEIQHRHIVEMSDEELYELIRSGGRTLEAEEGSPESSELHDIH